jgi:hypothetical protein
MLLGLLPVPDQHRISGQVVPGASAAKDEDRRGVAVSVAGLAGGEGAVTMPDTSPGVAPEDPVAAAIRDVAQFLDIDVHQVTRVRVFVAADHPPGDAVQMRQAWEPIAGQYPVHGGWVQPEGVGDAGGAPPARETDLDDPPLGPGRGGGQYN